MRDLTEDEIQREIDFIDSEPGWPAWPLLPVKHIDRGDKDFEGASHGVIGCNEPDGKRTVYFKNLYDFETGALGPQLEGVERETYESTEALVNAGWIAD